MVNGKTIRKMEKFIVYAQSKNYVFSAIDNNIDLNSSDDDLDLCKSPLNVMKGWINMFIRLQNVARTNKKYLLLFSLFYSMVGLIILSIILLILFK